MYNLWKTLSYSLIFVYKILIYFPNLPGKESVGRLGYTWCPEQIITASKIVDSCFSSFSETISHWPVIKKLGHFFILVTRVLKKTRNKLLLFTVLWSFLVCSLQYFCGENNCCVFSWSLRIMWKCIKIGSHSESSNFTRIITHWDIFIFWHLVSRFGIHCTEYSYERCHVIWLLSLYIDIHGFFHSGFLSYLLQ